MFESGFEAKSGLKNGEAGFYEVPEPGPQLAQI